MVSITAKTAPGSLQPKTAPCRLAGYQPRNHPLLVVEEEMCFGSLSISAQIEPALAPHHPQLLDRGPMWLMVRSSLGARDLPRIHPDNSVEPLLLPGCPGTSHFFSCTQPPASDSLSSGSFVLHQPPPRSLLSTVRSLSTQPQLPGFTPH